VAINVRGREVLVQNTHPGVVMFCKPCDAEGLLDWFLTEIGNEIITHTEQTEGLPPLQDTGGAASSSQQALVPSGSRPDEDAQTLAVDLLKKHPRVKRVCWQPSRTGFKVVRDDGSSKEFGCEGFLKKRKLALTHLDDLAHPAWTALQASITDAGRRARAFLDELGTGASAEPDMVPLLG